MFFKDFKHERGAAPSGAAFIFVKKVAIAKVLTKNGF